MTVDELLPLVKAVVRGTKNALVVADLPFGSYQIGPEQALTTAFRFMKEGGAHAVKLEGGARFVPQVEALAGSGIPVMAHLGFTPQSEHALGGFRIQGRGDAGEHLIEDALALQSAGAFAVVLEMVPADVAKRVTGELVIPTIGIGAGPDCDAQVLVWSDMAGYEPRPQAEVRQAVRGHGLDPAGRCPALCRGGPRRGVPGHGALLQLTPGPGCAALRRARVQTPRGPRGLPAA